MYWMSNGKQLDMNSITRMEYHFKPVRCNYGLNSCPCSNWDDETSGRNVILINSQADLNGFVVEYTQDYHFNNPQAAACWLKRMIFSFTKYIIALLKLHIIPFHIHS